ncbi:MAG: FMN adenylyltransferase [Clostridiales bacterium]|nr:FMN adenylyltransferase [Clostridiales bacterium]
MRITGTISHGKHLGHRLGFPTANIAADHPLAEGERGGVYAAVISIERIEGPLACMVNIGRHPTAPEGPPTIEAHILDFDEDVYGRRAVLETKAFIRPERKFETLDKLVEQLERDREAVRNMGLV